MWYRILKLSIQICLWYGVFWVYSVSMSWCKVKNMCTPWNDYFGFLSFSTSTLVLFVREKIVTFVEIISILILISNNFCSNRVILVERFINQHEIIIHRVLFNLVDFASVVVGKHLGPKKCPEKLLYFCLKFVNNVVRSLIDSNCA